MKTVTGSLVVAASFGLALLASAPANAVPFISITDLTEGSPSVSTSGFDITGSVVSGPDTVSFSGTLHIPFGEGVISGTQNFVLNEQGGGISDILSVTGGVGSIGANDFLEQLTVSFTSVDGLVAPLTEACALLENGEVQSCGLFSQTGANILNLSIQSDVDIAVPEPGSLALLGTAVAALGLIRRRRSV